MPREQRIQAHERTEETKQTILRTARELFMEYGYRAVSTRQLADACGLTQPALYHYFADKQDLYVAMVEDEVSKMNAALELIASRHDGVQERLRRVVLYLMGATQHDLTLMLHDIRHELSLERRSEVNKTFQAGVIRPIASIFIDGLQQGLLRDQQHGGVDPLMAAYLFMGIISQFIARPEIGKPDTPRANHSSSDELADLIVSFVLHGLAYSHGEEPGEVQSRETGSK